MHTKFDIYDYINQMLPAKQRGWIVGWVGQGV